VSDTAPHAPSRGRTARLLGRFHVTGVFWYRIHAWGAARPEWVIRSVLPLFTAFFFVTLRRIRGAVTHNLEAVLGTAGWFERQRRIWRTFHVFAWSLTERYERLLTDRPFEVTVEHIEHWRRLVDSGRGVVLVTGHIGNWEMASTLPEAQEGRRIHVVREEEMDPEAQAFVEERLRRRAGAGYTTHFAADADPRLGLKLREALDRGEVVALQGDRPRRGGRTVPAVLFERPYRVPAGPLALARQAEVPLLPAFVFRTGRRRYVVRFGEPVVVARGGDREGELAAAAREVAAAVEGAVRFRPHQWFVFRELWG
jgi:phosphatidylinositol dimannoside acyltransferase